MNFEFAQIEDLFPFSMVADGQGRILRVGKSLQKILLSDLQNAPLTDVFEVLRPKGASLEKADLNCGVMLTIQERKSKAHFMGQIIRLSDDRFFYAINLLVHDAERLKELRLSFADFAVQDPIFDFLMLLQTQRRAIRESAELNAKLADAHRSAVDSSEMKSKFLANMSHELRTPMNGVIGMASILMETPLNEEQSDHLKSIMTSGEAMVSLVNDILDLSKVEAGHLELTDGPLDLSEVVSGVHQAVQSLADEKGVELAIDLETLPARAFLGDASRLRQIFLNLVGNAIKFTDAGSVTIRLESVVDQNARMMFTFAVKDTGIGMDEETRSKIFSPFVQGDISMSKKYGGTGLGLSICRRLVEAMGGTISLESNLGEGSTFRFGVSLLKAS